MKSTENEYLKVNKMVVLTDALDAVIWSLDVYFSSKSLHAAVVSGVRTRESQLALIIKYAKENLKIAIDFIDQDITKKLDNGLYVWQYTWSLLLENGIIINPPVPAVCLTHYISATGDDHFNKEIRASGHLEPACSAFDISGTNPDNGDNILDRVKGCIDSARADWPKIGIENYLVERKNNCVHVNIIKV